MGTEKDVAEAIYRALKEVGGEEALIAGDTCGLVPGKPIFLEGDFDLYRVAAHVLAALDVAPEPSSANALGPNAQRDSNTSL